MNPILQKRIEEAAKKMSHNKMAFWEDCDYSTKDIEEIIYDASKLTAVHVLQNQWISVNEALPEETEDGFCDDKFVLYCSEYPATASYNHKSKKWYCRDYEILGVTHWMPIPSLEGGEK